MAVAHDADSGGVNAVGIFSTTQTSTNFMTVGASATILIIGLEIETAAAGTFTAHWDSAGTNQVMTQIGSNAVIGTSFTLALFGLVSPTSGLKNLSYSFSGVGTSTNGYVYGVSFTGSNTSSVASATEGNVSSTGTSTTASVTTSVSIPATDMATAWFIDGGSGFTGSFVNGATQADGGKAVGINQALGANGAAEYYTGAGSTITASAGLAASDPWAAMIVGIKVAGAAANPFVSHISDLPPRGFVYSEWQKFTDDTNTQLPTPTILTQTLRVQKDFPNPYPVTWYRSWEEQTVLPRPTPFLPVQLPNLSPVGWYQTWTQSLLQTTLAPSQTNPFVQKDWPNPRPVIWYQSWTQSFQQAIPFNQLDWSLPKTNQPLLQTWSQSLNLFFQSETFPFVQSDYPNPQRIVWYKDWSINLLETTLAPAFQAPFNQFDWPLSRTYSPIDQFWYNNLQLLPRPTPFFQNVDFPLPVVSQPIDQTWLQNLLSFFQSNTFPFSQTDWKNPYPIYWYEDHNQNLVIYLPVGIMPFSQSDWPLTRSSQPIDQFGYQALVLNLPVPPAPPEIISSGRYITEAEVSAEVAQWWKRQEAASLISGSEFAQLGASKGGIARAKSLTSQQRSEIGTKAITTRWQSPRK